MHWDAFIIKAINFQDPIKGEMSNDHGTARMSKLTRFLFPGALNLWITRIEWGQHLRQWLHPHKKGNTPPPDISWLSIFSIVKFFSHDIFFLDPTKKDMYHQLKRSSLNFWDMISGNRLLLIYNTTIILQNNNLFE